MRHVSKMMLCSLMSLLLAGCGAAEFSGTNANSKASADDANGTLKQGANDDSNGSLRQDDSDSSDGNLPQISLDDFLGALGQVPNVPADPGLVSLYEEEFRCYISHSGGHGMDLCVTDPTPLLPLSTRGLDPRVEVKGNSICAKRISITTHADLFKAAGAVVGECN